MSRQIASIALLLTASLRADEPAPRYAFAAGQEIRYRLTASTKHGQGEDAAERGGRAEWSVWVARANDDGGFRLVLRWESKDYRVAGGKKREYASGVHLGYADISSDGRLVPNGTIPDLEQLRMIFPRLPKNPAEAAKGWTWESDGEKVKARRLAGRGFRFDAVPDSPMHAIFRTTSRSTYTFDRGRVAAAETTFNQGIGDIRGTVTAEMLGVKSADAGWLKQLAADEGRYFAAVLAYEKALHQAVEAGPDGAKERLGAAGAALRAVKVDQPMLKLALAERVGGHERATKSRLAAIDWRAKGRGKPAVAFETTNLDGKPVKLADFRGKVVVLDFWSRCCPNCIRAMPQLNQLTADFAGQLVAVLGMNLDEKEEDARFVIDKMGLKYPTLKAFKLFESFGIQGLPTILVIDRRGRVHDTHIGHSPTLREDIGRQVRRLLDEE